MFEQLYLQLIRNTYKLITYSKYWALISVWNLCQVYKCTTESPVKRSTSDQKAEISLKIKNVMVKVLVLLLLLLFMTVESQSC